MRAIFDMCFFWNGITIFDKDGWGGGVPNDVLHIEISRKRCFLFLLSEINKNDWGAKSTIYSK